MRQFCLPLVIAAVLGLSACGTPATFAPAPQGALALAARSEVPEGKLIFDKNIIYKAVDVLGVGSVYSAKLEAAGIETVNQLLLAGAKRSERDRLAKQTGISNKRLLTWINHADLMRVTGVGPEYSRLLERAGVDTVLELAERNPNQLPAKLRAANALGGGKVCVHRLPDAETTLRWVANAKTFVRVVRY